MGRFDALTHLEEEKPSAPLSVVSSPTQKKSPVQPPRNNIEEKQKPEIMISRNHDAPSPIDSFKDKPSKYSTILDASLIKKIKLFAAEKEIKDYEVIELVLTEYFNKQHNSLISSYHENLKRGNPILHLFSPVLPLRPL